MIRRSEELPPTGEVPRKPFAGVSRCAGEGLSDHHHKPFSAMRTSLVLTAVLALAVFGAAPAIAQDPTLTTDVVGVVSGSPDHTTLAGALTSAGLVETLEGDGPFTIFAPTDAAFARCRQRTRRC